MSSIVQEPLICIRPGCDRLIKCRGLCKSHYVLWWRSQTDTASTVNKKRDFELLTLNGKTQSLSDWARDTGIKYQTLIWRINAGWPVNKVLSTPLRRYTSQKAPLRQLLGV